MTFRSSADRNSEIDRAAWQPTLAPGIRCQEADDEVIVLDKKNRRVHQLNRTGAAVLRYCDGTNAIADIAEHLLQEFDVGPKRLSADVAALTQKLKALGLLK